MNEINILTEEQGDFLRKLLHYVENRENQTIPIQLVQMVDKIKSTGQYTKLEKGLLNYWRKKYIDDAYKINT